MSTRPATVDDLWRRRPLKWKDADQRRRAGGDPGTDYHYTTQPETHCQSGVMVRCCDNRDSMGRPLIGWWDLGWFIVDGTP